MYNRADNYVAESAGRARTRTAGDEGAGAVGVVVGISRNAILLLLLPSHTHTPRCLRRVASFGWRRRRNRREDERPEEEREESNALDVVAVVRRRVLRMRADRQTPNAGEREEEERLYIQLLLASYNDTDAQRRETNILPDYVRKHPCMRAHHDAHIDKKVSFNTKT